MASPLIASSIPGAIIEQVENPVSMAPDGSGVGVIVQRAQWAVIQNNIPVPLTPHPSFPSLLLYEFTMEREAGQLGRVTGTYRGVLANNPQLLMQEEASVATSAEPIETHPLFAYPPASPPVTSAQINQINQALAQNIDISGSLAGAALTLYKKKLRGIDSFLRRGTTYKQNYCSNTYPTNYGGVGYIGFPGSNAPPAPTGAASAQNYIQTALAWRRQGGVIFVSLEWQLSGLGGWDTDLYGAPTFNKTAGGGAGAGLAPAGSIGTPLGPTNDGFIGVP